MALHTDHVKINHVQKKERKTMEERRNKRGMRKLYEYSKTSNTLLKLWLHYSYLQCFNK